MILTTKSKHMEYNQHANYSEDPKIEKHWDAIQTIDTMEDFTNLFFLSSDKEYRNIVDINIEKNLIHMKMILSNQIIFEIIDTQINNINSNLRETNIDLNLNGLFMQNFYMKNPFSFYFWLFSLFYWAWKITNMKKKIKWSIWKAKSRLILIEINSSVKDKDFGIKLADS